MTITPWRNSPGAKKWDSTKKCPACGFPMRDGQTFAKFEGVWMHAFCIEERT